MIRVTTSPPLNTIQDLGRPGFRDIGLTQGGAMDDLALRVANLLVGNSPELSVIEVQSFPFRLRALKPHLMAVTGADCLIGFGGKTTLPWSAMVLEQNQELVLGRPSQGARAYVSVAGGFDVERLLGSCSTDLRSGFGGFRGRDLRSGDELQVGPSVNSLPSIAHEGFGIDPPHRHLAFNSSVSGDEIAIRVLPGPEHGEFDIDSRNAFWSGLWAVTKMTDRMGMYLEGHCLLRRLASKELRSAGILPGVIQVPPSGAPLIQLRDANSAGGYPRIGVVAQSDLWRLAQASQQAKIRFHAVEREEALASCRDVSAYLDLVRKAITPFFSSR